MFVVFAIKLSLNLDLLSSALIETVHQVLKMSILVFQVSLISGYVGSTVLLGLKLPLTQLHILSK
jgi:hypothetical protein